MKAYMASPKEKGLCSGCWKAYTNPARARHFLKNARNVPVFIVNVMPKAARWNGFL
ncbi:hypothetical protein M5E89_13685 [Acidaminococcus intestini]|nr:hypothetical protein M5E89_13685 [Acidaminococcus intestini]